MEILTSPDPQPASVKANAQKEKIAILLVLGATIIWGSQYILMKQGGSQVSPFLFQAIRHLVAFIGFLPVWGRFRKMNKITFEGSLVSAIVFFFLLAFLTFGLGLTTSSKGAFLACLYVVFTPLMSFLILKVRPKTHHLAAVIVAMVGMGIMVFGNVDSADVELAPNLGDVLIIIAGILNAIQIVLIEKYVKHVDLWLFVMAQMVFLCIFFFIASFFTGELNNLSAIPTTAWGIMIYMGLFATTLTLIIQTWAQQFIESTRAALLYSLEPVFGMIFGVVLGGEIITIAFIIGAGLIMTGILWSSLKK